MSLLNAVHSCLPIMYSTVVADASSPERIIR